MRGLEVMVPFKPPMLTTAPEHRAGVSPLIARTCRRSSLASCGSTSGGPVDGGCLGRQPQRRPVCPLDDERKRNRSSELAMADVARGSLDTPARN